MKAKTAPKRKRVYRKPVQTRAQLTVEAMLDAAVRILKRDGVGEITTNRIAEVAGVSIGSVYQYFPSKQAIFIALHERHIDQVDRVIQHKISESAQGPLEGLVANLVDGMIEAHAADPELSKLLQSEVPHRAHGTQDFSLRFQSVFRGALARHVKELGKRVDLDTRVFFFGNMLEGLSHAILFRRPATSRLATLRAELIRVIVAYLRT